MRRSIETESEDGVCVEAIRHGDPQALAIIFDRYSEKLYRTAFRVLQHQHEAEDVVQDILIQLWIDPTSFNPDRGCLGAWLTVITRHRAIDAIRKRRAADPLENCDLRAKNNVAKEAEVHLDLGRIQDAIESLPVEQMSTLRLSFYEGLSHIEIAQRTGTPLGTVKTRIRSGIRSVRRLLKVANLALESHDQP